jgi:hypothetical protein
MRLFLILLILLGSSRFTTASDDQSAFERWDRAVCLHSPGGGAPETDNYASAFLVEHAGTLYLLTAAHAAQQTRRATRLRFRSPDGKPQWVSLGLLFPANGNPWKPHKFSDIAIATLADSDEAKPYRELLSKIAIPLTCLATERVQRTTRVEVAGFPFGFGVEERKVSPLVVMTHVASEELDAKNQWSTEPVIYTFPAVAQGTSGGPVFLGDDDSTTCVVVGMYIGVAFDASGGKLSKLIPSRVIRDAIIAHRQS